MTSKAERIDQIFRQRAYSAEHLASLDGSVARLDGAVGRLEEARRALQPKVDPDATAELLQIGASIDDLRRRVGTVQRDIGRTDARLRRQTLTIGAVGRGGQGKSRFLQSLTGLTDREIPAARGGFMTGAPSVIRHGDGPTTAEVEFHDATSFLTNIIGPYYRRLGLGPEPMSLAEFEATGLPEPPSNSSMRVKQAYDHLRAYRDNLGEYRTYLIDPVRVRPISSEQIQQFVAQHDGGGRVTHAFRAVRRVRITARFMSEDLGRLAVIDLPGLGDTNLHDEYVLSQALEEEVDLVLFIRRPDPLREDVHDVDIDLYDLARGALPELPIERWSFLVLNRVEGGDGDNTAMIEQFAAAVRRSRIKVSGIGVANSTDPAAVAAVFDTVVENAVGTLDDLDRMLVDRRRSEVAALLAEAALLIDQAQNLNRRAAPSRAWFPRFLQLFNGVHRSLSRGLEDLVQRLGDAITERDDGLDKAVQEAMQRARETVVPPTVEEIRDLMAAKGALGTVLNDLVNESRSQISRQFLPLDAALKQHVDAMLEQVAAVLAEAGRLPLAPSDRASARDRLRELEARLPEGATVAELRYGFRFLTEFVLNYRGMIQHRIRRVLSKLTPDLVPYEPSAGPDQVRYMIEELVAETLFEIETALQEMVFEPREAVFAVVEEFRDRVLRSPGAKDEWRTVYEALRGEVWAEEFEALAANTTLFNRWNEAIAAVAAIAAAHGEKPMAEVG